MEDGKTQRTSKADRFQRLLELLEYEPEGFERLFLFYDHESGATLPDVASYWCKCARAVSRLA